MAGHQGPPRLLENRLKTVLHKSNLVGMWWKRTRNGSPNSRTWVAVAAGRCGILALAPSDQAAKTTPWAAGPSTAPSTTCPALLISRLTLEAELNSSSLYSSARSWEQRWTHGPYLVRTSHLLLLLIAFVGYAMPTWCLLGRHLLLRQCEHNRA